MSERKIGGRKRAVELVRYLTMLRAHGLGKAQMRALARVYNDTVLDPPVNRRGILTPDRRPRLTPLPGVIGQA